MFFGTFLWKIRSAFLVKIANLNNKEHTLVRIARHRAGCSSICVQVFGDTLREVDGSPLLFCIMPLTVARGQIKIIMRAILVVIITFFCGTNAFAQESYDGIIGECYQIDAKNGNIYLSGGNEDEYEIRSVKQVVSLMRKDVFGYFGINQKHSTPLQKRAFSKTEEYTNYMSVIDYHHSYISDSKFYILYNLRYNQAYDLNKKAFVFRVMVLDFLRTNQAGYLGFGKNINTSLPSNMLMVKKERRQDGELYANQYIQIPIADENLALKIEEDMANPYCSTYLMFVVQLNKTSTEKHPEFMFAQDNILAKTVNLYMVNTKTEQIYCDLSELVGGVKSQIAQSKPVSPKVEFKEENQNEEAERREADARRIEHVRQTKQEANDNQSNVGVAQSNASYNIVGRAAKSLPYPSLKNEFEEGKVIVEVEVNPEGKVVDAKILSKGTTIKSNGAG